MVGERSIASWSLELLIRVLHLRQADFPLPDLLAELVNLAFLPDITDRRTRNQQAQKQRLQRRPKPDHRRLTFSIFSIF